MSRGGRQIVPRPSVWSHVDAAPWGTTVDTVSGLDPLMRVIPTQERPAQPAFVGARSAAVLVTLAEGEHGPEVLLTRRSWTLRHHRGEISFPGGRMDPGESAVDTALREAHEEVGLDPARVEVIGELEHLNTVVSRSYIIPKVAVLTGERPELRPSVAEVERIMWVPLAELVAPGTYHGERWGTPPTDRLLHFFELSDETVWGATAHMLVDLLTRGSRPG
jgi:8-oxo-dGTP pyrophosphatase MutT (NUDIX family)